MKIYKLLAALLDYPTEITPAILVEAGDILEGSEAVTRSDKKHMDKFVGHFRNIPLTAWQTEYSDLFDTSGQLSLYLFEYVYGSSRMRGQAMSDLIDTYRDAGIEVSSGELPDYLPVFLEFLSFQSTPQDADDYLADIKKILDPIHTKLKKAGSPYAELIAILLDHAAKGTSHPLPPREEMMVFDGRDDRCANCELAGNAEPSEPLHV